MWTQVGFSDERDGLAWIDPITFETILFALSRLFIGWTDKQNFLLIMVTVIPSVLGFIGFFKRIQYGGYWIGLTIFPFTGLLIVSLFRPMFHERYLSMAIFAYVIMLVLGYKALDDYLIPRFKNIGKAIVCLIIAIHLINIALLTITHLQSDQFATNYAKQGIDYVQSVGKGGDYVVTSYWHVTEKYYLDSTKFWYLEDTYSFAHDYELTQKMPFSRVWIVTQDNHYLKTLAEENNFNPVYQVGDVTVYFINTEE